MFPLALALGGLGALKGYNDNRRADNIEESSRKLAADTARYSPWTGMAPGQIQYNKGSMFGSVLGGALQGGLAGGQMGGFGGAEQVQSPWEALQQKTGMQPASQQTKFGQGMSYFA
jgi:outer membrane lipoprotein SlyB